jgi:hypothetical protein
MAVTWCDADDVRTFLGLDPSDTFDDDWLDLATSAANQEAFDLRATSGYDDLEGQAPSDRVKVGTIMLAARNYHQRGGGDVAAGFESLGGPVPVGPSLADVRRKLGVPKPVAVA